MGLHVKALLFLVNFNQTWISWQGFSEETPVENVTEMGQRELRSMWTEWEGEGMRKQAVAFFKVSYALKRG